MKNDEEKEEDGEDDRDVEDSLGDLETALSGRCGELGCETCFLLEIEVEGFAWDRKGSWSNPGL